MSDLSPREQVFDSSYWTNAVAPLERQVKIPSSFMGDKVLNQILADTVAVTLLHGGMSENIPAGTELTVGNDAHPRFGTPGAVWLYDHECLRVGQTSGSIDIPESPDEQDQLLRSTNLPQILRTRIEGSRSVTPLFMQILSPEDGAQYTRRVNFAIVGQKRSTPTVRALLHASFNPNKVITIAAMPFFTLPQEIGRVYSSQHENHYLYSRLRKVLLCRPGSVDAEMGAPSFAM